MILYPPGRFLRLKKKLRFAFPNMLENCKTHPFWGIWRLPGRAPSLNISKYSICSHVL